MYKAIVVNDTSFEPHHGSKMVMRNIRKLLKLNGIKIICSNPVGRDWNKNKIKQKILSSDVVIINGEGTLHHSQQRAIELIRIVKFCKDNKIKVVLINSTFEKNNNEIIDLSRELDLVFVRESYSKNELLKEGINSIVVPDLTFYLNPKFSNSKKLYYSYTDSVKKQLSKELYESYLNCPGKKLFLPPLKLVSYKKSYNIFIKDHLKFYIIKLLLIFKLELPYEMVRYNHFISNTNKYLKRINDSKLLFTGRFHSLCFSILTKTPFLCLKSNSYKIEGLLTDINMSHRLVDNPKMTARNFDFTNEEIVLLENYVDDGRKKIEYMFRTIAEYIK
jgi:polysaccharide pyruvyl transferase WcaK-like protein